MSDPAERAAERIADDISEDNEREAWIAEAADIIREEYGESMARLRARLFAGIQVTGCSHSTACSIWGDDGQGHTKENYPQPLPCNCGALINFERQQGAKERELMPCGHPRACWMWGVPYAGNPMVWKPHCSACKREAAAVQARDRQWCSELAKHDVAARAMYPGGIEIEVPTIAEAVEGAYEAAASKADELDVMRQPICGSHIASEIRALTPAIAQAALDRKVNEALLKELLCWHNPASGYGTDVAILERIDELKSMLGKD